MKPIFIIKEVHTPDGKAERSVHKFDFWKPIRPRGLHELMALIFLFPFLVSLILFNWAFKTNSWYRDHYLCVYTEGKCGHDDTCEEVIARKMKRYYDEKQKEKDEKEFQSKTRIKYKKPSL